MKHLPKIEALKDGIRNQYVIETANGQYFQSYHSLIAFRPIDANKPILVNKKKWDYSMTTRKYLYYFLNIHSQKELYAMEKQGKIRFTDDLD